MRTSRQLAECAVTKAHGLAGRLKRRYLFSKTEVAAGLTRPAASLLGSRAAPVRLVTSSSPVHVPGP